MTVALPTSIADVVSWTLEPTFAVDVTFKMPVLTFPLTLISATLERPEPTNPTAETFPTEALPTDTDDELITTFEPPALIKIADVFAETFDPTFADVEKRAVLPITDSTAFTWTTYRLAQYLDVDPTETAAFVTGTRLESYCVDPVIVRPPPIMALPETCNSPAMFAAVAAVLTDKIPPSEELPVTVSVPPRDPFPVTFNAPITFAECSILNT